MLLQQEFNGSIEDVVPFNRMWKIHDGGDRQFGSSSISASRQDSNAVSTANSPSPFSGPGI